MVQIPVVCKDSRSSLAAPARVFRVTLCCDSGHSPIQDLGFCCGWNHWVYESIPPNPPYRCSLIVVDFDRHGRIPFHRGLAMVAWLLALDFTTVFFALVFGISDQPRRLVGRLR